MFRYILYGSSWLLCLLLTLPLSAQIDCKPERDATVITQGDVLFDYGSTTNAFNFTRRSDITIGQPVVGQSLSRTNIMEFGFWTRFFLPPIAPTVTATQGDLLDRIRVSWTVDPLSPSPDGFNIFRDGVFLESVGRDIRNYNDFNVIAGTPYTYTVSGFNQYGDGSVGSALGFQVPNGTVTGLVQTASGNPVPDALITLTPMQGYSLKFGFDGGAYVDTTGTGLESLLPSQDHWSVTFWMKTDLMGTDSSASATILDFAPHQLDIRPISGFQAGVALYLDNNFIMEAPFPDTLQNDWNHVGLTYDGTQYRFYIDGELASLAPGDPITSVTEIDLGAAGNRGWEGSLDELRIYHRLLDELDFDNVKNGTASTLTPGLKAYWKFDEGQGQKSFDLINRSQIHFCGAEFSEDRPPVRIAGVTNEEGYYRIEAASYGTGTTFLAHPSKNFYAQRALKFVREEEDYAELPDFGMTEKATLELWINSAGPDGTQTVLSKSWNGNRFEIRLIPAGTDNLVALNLFGAGGGDSSTIGALGMGYQHLAFTIDSTAGTLQAYKNGELFGSPFNIPVSFGNWTDSLQNWVLGASRLEGDTTSREHYGGLIAEVAVYDTILDQSRIQEHVNEARDPQEPGLRIYFALNEGSGNRLNNQGSVLTDRGHPYGASWTNFAPNQSTTPHVMTPKSRQVTLNPSVTSVDQVDFIDRSTVPVSGYVRYTGTDCFAPNVEILVNGDSYNPAIFTDSTGRFTIDFDPGATAVLSPKLEDHQFSPASWEVTNVVNPIAGVVFNDMTTRTISGQLAGGECKKSIIKAPPGEGQGTVAIVTIRSVDGCYQRQLTIDNQEGNYTFENVPPLEEITVAVTEHSDPKIKAAFQTEGGVTVDLSDRTDTIVDFIYFAEPEVRILGLDPVTEDCDQIVLEQNSSQKITIELFEQYVVTDTDDGICKLDTGNIRILNGLADVVLDTILSEEQLEYEFQVGVPNPSPPFLKTLQAVGETINGREGTSSVQAIVTGILNKLPTFTTKSPEIPWLILRDPPGDASYSYWEKNTKVCNYTRFYREWSVGGGGGVTIDNGPDTKITFPTGGPILETETKIGGSVSGLVSYRNIKDDVLEICMSTNERISTSGSDQFIGKNADVYVGMGLNIQVGIADVVSFDPNKCEASLGESLTVEPLTPTTFMYSQYQIENNVVRLLEKIAVDTNGNRTSQDSLEARQSVENWKKIIARNDSLKKSVNFDTYKSFDAGASFEYQTSIDSSNTNTLDQFLDVEGEVKVFAGGSLGGLGVQGEIRAVTSNSFPLSLSTDQNGGGNATGYVLSDDDIGDAFAVAIGMDTTYQTPVFKLQAGQSSCPWEPGTANREYPNLALAEGSSFEAVNIPSKEAAVFQFNLGNLSATNEDMTYALSAIAASNPHGAIIQVNGTTLNGNPVRYTVPFGQSIPVTVTVKRGPVEYDYEKLSLVLYSECQAAQAYGLGIPADNLDSLFFSKVDLNVHFIRPCSEVDINVPEQNWVVRNNDPAQPGTIRRITTSGYNLSVPDFKLVRLQYRRSDGDGAWINIRTPEGEDYERYNPNWSGFNGRSAEEIGSDTLLLNPDFTQFLWETVGLTDGDYEIHAVAVCSGDAADKPGYSEIIKGRIDREPPKIVGLTEPADGVYHVGDEISATFNKFINCDSAIVAFRPKSVGEDPDNGLYFSGTGDLIDANVTCYENKLIIHPNFQNPNSFIENKLLRVELGKLQDLTGNKIADPLVWEFFVDRNELAWLTDSVGMTLYEDETARVTAKVHNRSGTPMPFSIEDAPDWVRVFPDTGYLVANEVMDINFEVEANALGMGSWSDRITLKTHPGQNPNYWGGTETLRLGARVISRPPNWEVDPNEFQMTMVYIGELEINGITSTDPEDRLAVFVEDELRGVANVLFDEASGKHLVFMEVYSELTRKQGPLEFRVWDASEGTVYSPVMPVNHPGLLEFEENAIRGSRQNPVIFRNTESIEQDYNLSKGYNWVSFPLSSDDLNHYEDMLDGLPFGNFDHVLWEGNDWAVHVTGSGWIVLRREETSLTRSEMIKVFLEKPGSFSYSGIFNSPADDPRDLAPEEWNWIGFISLERMDINSALGNLSPSTGDIVKGQRGFAVYEEGYGWGGSLTYLEPTHGYKLRTAQGGTLIYPEANTPAQASLKHLEIARDRQLALEAAMDLQVTGHKDNMSIIGAVKDCKGQTPVDGAYLAAFVGKECRGIAPLKEQNGKVLSYLTVYGEKEEEEQVSFMLLDAEMKPLGTLSNYMSFSDSDVIGIHSDPYVFELVEDCNLSPGAPKATVHNHNIRDLSIYPNPFNEQIVVEMNLDVSESVTISLQDINGRLIDVLYDGEMNAGRQRIVWEAENNRTLSSGIYFLHIQSDTMHKIEKMIR